jgi:hypothetical protein
VSKSTGKAAAKAAPAAAKPAGRASAGASGKAPAKSPVKAVARAATKPVAKSASKAAAKPAARAGKAVSKVATPKTRTKAPGAGGVVAADEVTRDKVRKTKLVRDSFTMPEQEYAVLNQVKKACLKAGFEVKKSELLRIGVALISQIDLATLQSVLSGLPHLKTGRPKKDESEE